MPQIVPLSRNHNRSGFDCGDKELNAFLRATARQHDEKGVSRTFVLADQKNSTEIIGFFTLTLCEVNVSQLPAAYEKKYPKHGLPAVRLARLAVARKHQGQGFGELLLAEAIHRTVVVAEQAGVIGLFVDAKNKSARMFYERYGFILLSNRSLQLFLPLASLRAASNSDT